MKSKVKIIVNTIILISIAIAIVIIIVYGNTNKILKKDYSENVENESITENNNSHSDIKKIENISCEFILNKVLS